MLAYLKKLISSDEAGIQPPGNQPRPTPTGLSGNALQEALGNLPIDQPLLTLDLDPRYQADSYPVITGGYIVPNGLVLDTAGGRQVIKRTVFRRVKVRQDTPTTGTVFLEADDEFIIKLAGLRNFERVVNVLGTLVMIS